MLNKLFPTSKPYLDEEGNLLIPSDIRWGVAGLKTREWLTLIYLSIDSSHCQDKEAIKEYERAFCGSIATRYRTVKSLKKKGFSTI